MSKQGTTNSATEMEAKARIEARRKFAGSLIKLFDIHIPSKQLEITGVKNDKKDIYEFFLHYGDQIVNVDGRAIINFRNNTVQTCVERVGRHHGRPVNYYRWYDYTMDTKKLP